MLAKALKMKSSLSKPTKTTPKRCNLFTVWFPKELTDQEWCFNLNFQTRLTKVDVSSRVFRSGISDFYGASPSTISTSSMNAITQVQTSWATTRFARCKQIDWKCNNPWHAFLKQIIWDSSMCVPNNGNMQLTGQACTPASWMLASQSAFSNRSAQNQSSICLSWIIWCSHACAKNCGRVVGPRDMKTVQSDQIAMSIRFYVIN